MPRGRKAPKHWPAEPRERDVDGVRRAGRRRRSAGDLVAEHACRRCGSTLRIGRSISTVLRVARAPAAASSISSLVERLVEPVVLPVRLRSGLAVVVLGHLQDRRRGRGRRAFQWSIAARRVEHLGVADRLRDACGSRARPGCSRTSSAMNSKKLTTNSGLPVNRSRSSGFWVATPTGQVSRWQTRIMTQPRHHERRGGEAELLGAEQRARSRRRGRS